MFIERNEEFNQLQNLKYGPIIEDIDKNCKIIEDSQLSKSSKQYKKETVDKHIERKLERWEFLHDLSHESMCYGFFMINLAYLMFFVSCNFVLFRYLSNSLSYSLSTIFTSIGTLMFAEHFYGFVE